MGQYYTPITAANGQVQVYNFFINDWAEEEPQGAYIGLKITEHSWWENDFLKALTTKLLHHPMVVAWVGDYCKSDERYEELSCRWAEIDSRTLYEVQEMYDAKDKEQHIEKGDLTLEGKYLVNHTKKLFLDGSLYLKNFSEEDWITHPLPLLTAIGNKHGGGDYYGEQGADYIGSWALDLISVEDAVPVEYNLLDIFFKE